MPQLFGLLFASDDETIWKDIFRQGKGKHFDRLFLIDWYAGKARH
jgi:hypothetical protein